MRKFYFFPIIYFCFPLLSLADNVSEDDFELSLQSLLDIEVTSVSKQSQPLSNAPAAIYVITSDDIKRSGATSIPQALRDVPGLHVAQIDSQMWAISSRGFNGRFNNKLLVLMDGRVLYSPTFSGVYWENQDTLMTDIERIEIIRGPGAALWGANAVNGVINIITKHSADTIGGYAELGVGNYEENFAGFRYGGKLSENATGRAYVKGFKRDSLKQNPQDVEPNLQATVTGIDTDNDWRSLQSGGRIDMQLDAVSTLALSADIYQSTMQHSSQFPIPVMPYSDFIHDSFNSRGWNILAKYTQALSANSEYSFQTYYDHNLRDDPSFNLTIDTIDFDFQHQFQAGEKHNFIWGLGYRYIEDKLNESHQILTTTSSKFDTRLWSLFIRDEITLLPNQLWLTLASRFEHNSYTGFEAQPNARLMWQLNDKHKLWSSIAYAVRTPSRLEDNFSLLALTQPAPPPFSAIKLIAEGNEDYDSEKIISYEAGYRFNPTVALSFDLSLFYHDYDKLRGTTASLPDSSGFPIITVVYKFDNSQEGYNYGAELSSQWVASNAVRFKVNYGYIDSNFKGRQTQGTDAPKHIISALADWDVTDDIRFNLTWRYVGKVNAFTGEILGGKQVDSYHGVDIGLNWQVTPAVSIAAYGKNLLYPSHVQYIAEQFYLPYRVEPSYYAKVMINF